MRYLADPQVQVALVWTGLAFLGGGLVTLPFAYFWGKRRGRAGAFEEGRVAGAEGKVKAVKVAYESGRATGELLGRREGVRAYHAERTAKANATRERKRINAAVAELASAPAIRDLGHIEFNDGVDDDAPVPASFVDTGEGEE